MSVINDVQTNCVCALFITITSYFCLNTAQYICSRVLEKFVRINGDHTGIRQIVLTEETIY